RPQSFAFPLFAGYLAILTGYRLGWNNRLWLLPVLMVVWVNTHGSFVMGLALIGLSVLGEVSQVLFRRLRGDHTPTARSTGEGASARTLGPLIRWGAVTAAGVLLNPGGLAIVEYVRNAVGHSAV